MSCVQIQRLFLLCLVLFFGMVTTAEAKGAEIADLTGPVQQLFEALRSPHLCGRLALVS